MLQELLKFLAGGGAHTPESLARELGASRDMVERMLADLARMGYLRDAGGGCAAKCAGCPEAGACAVGTPQRVWALTDKGRTAASPER
jgi:predicted ArsR family transcriptional regulator